VIDNIAAVSDHLLDSIQLKIETFELARTALIKEKNK
jgi:hypothetical protein